MKQFGHTFKEVSGKSKIEEVVIDEVVYVHITAVLQRKMPDLYMNQKIDVNFSLFLIR